MNYFVQYHNVANEGLLIADPPFSQTHLAIYTRLAHVQNAEGRIFLIAGIGKPRRYFLWSTFQIADASTNADGTYRASGDGWQLAPPQELKGVAFNQFRLSCANFVGFREITKLPYSKSLDSLAQKRRSSGNAEEGIAFFRSLKLLLKKDTESLALIDRAIERLQSTGTSSIREPTTAISHPTRALSIRQPHAEAIMRGVKKTEIRTKPTKIRGRIFIYAALGRYSADSEAALMRKYGIDDVACDDLPRGVIVGTVDLHDCEEGDWHVRKPERAETLLKPKNQPQPSWFKPF